jgi:hypothetical protein
MKIYSYSTKMKKMTLFITGLLRNNKPYSSLISEAISEGFRETLREMGYRVERNDEKENKKQPLRYTIKNYSIPLDKK